MICQAVLNKLMNKVRVMPAAAQTLKEAVRMLQFNRNSSQGGNTLVGHQASSLLKQLFPLCPYDRKLHFLIIFFGLHVRNITLPPSPPPNQQQQQQYQHAIYIPR